MNILMLTNTFFPHVGGVARSVEQFSQELRDRGHRVMVVAPSYDKQPANESDVVRISSIRHFNGTTFSLPLPAPGLLHERLEAFRPDVVHSHHPFLLGDTALRIAAARDLPIVFTHHTLYEKYTHYVVANSATLRRFVADLAISYGNLCDAVIAPSRSVCGLLRASGAVGRMEVMPTGVDLTRFRDGDPHRFRKAMGIPPNAFVVGHVGRLAVEKNLEFLAEAVALFLAQYPEAWFLVAGSGPCRKRIKEVCAEQGVSSRLDMQGVLHGHSLADFYHAMDVFAFASLSETQGMVLTEAMAAGVPVVALDGPGVRETVIDQCNGRLLARQDVQAFAAALEWCVRQPVLDHCQMKQAARKTADRFSMRRSTDQLIALYASLVGDATSHQHNSGDVWTNAARRIAQEWQIWENALDSAGDAILHTHEMV